ncbi:hypothetical protein JYP52_21320 [Nitratireductor aquibiodomus]|uniref:hypothetical protein n=1 Tax=Nitratireductor aquibiodomus TaxID=204799 RepID=UPI0019D32849|nr:hypothetical protein [Nitratireductor aquibiodomus]MBN7763682.1 hypothetical protein [Nitratireductor aquibiodomus]
MIDLSHYVITYPLSVDTLWKLKKLGMGMIGYCVNRNCDHFGEIDLDRLMEKLGPEFRFVGDKTIARSLKCPVCGHKGGDVKLRANTGPSK